MDSPMETQAQLRPASNNQTSPIGLVVNHESLIRNRQIPNQSIVNPESFQIAVADSRIRRFAIKDSRSGIRDSQAKKVND
jgi:hypothetical protein